MKHDDPWFERLVNRSKGHRLDQFRMIDTLFQESQAIKQDLFDGRKYDEILNQAIELAELVSERAVDNPTWQQLVQDAYLSLWKAVPSLREQAEMRPSHVVNWATMAKLLEAGDYEELRTWTKLDDWAAAMGTVSLAVRLAQFFDEQEDLIDMQNKLHDQEQSLMDQLEQLQQQAEKDMTDEEIQDELDQMLSDLDAYSDAVEDMENAAGAEGVGLKDAINQGVQQAKDSAEESIELVMGFGTSPGQWQKLDPRKRMELAKRLHGNPTLLKIAEMVGKMKRLAIGQWSRRVIHGTDEIYDVTTGSDLARTLPSELMYLAEEDTEDVFWMKWLEGTLLNYDLRGTDKVAKGAMIVLLDNSYSMAGDREVWGKAFALSLLEICKRERRDFYGIHFGWGQQNLREWYFPKGEVEIEDVLDYAEGFWASGTDFETPIGRAVDVLQDHFMTDGAVKGDIIMITDGEAQVGDEWLIRFWNAKEALDFKLYGTLIGHYGAVLDALSDQLWTVQDIVSGEEVKEVFTFV